VEPPHKWRPVPDPEVYELREPFPGKVVSLDTGTDDHVLQTYVRFFPVQYVPKKRKAFVIKEATVKVTFRENSEPVSFHLRKPGFDGSSATDASCLIISPSALVPAAKKLANFHRETHHVKSSVISTGDLASNYLQAGDPPQPGYRDQSLPGSGQIQYYDYALAKQIIAYLNDREAHSQLQTLILLGDGLLVPPSYYYYFAGEVEGNRWIPTDFFFASPDYDWVPNFKVGRLPVNNLEEANRLVDKIIRWQHNVSWSWFKHVYACGFVNHFSLQAESEGLLDGMVYERFVEQDGRFEAPFVEPAFHGEGVGILYHLYHGSGEGMKLNHSEITAGELMDLRQNDQIPIVISIACDNGSSDRDLVGSRPFDFRDPNDLSLPTFGEAVLKSSAGGIAYFGGTRRDAGGHNWYYVDGQPVVAKQFYMAALVGLPWFRAYRKGAETLGHLYQETVQAYLLENDLSADSRHWVPLVEFTLLGDPELRIPHWRE
jgi:hypothetical protein